MKKRIEYLDSLKAVCILMVVFCHFVLLPADSAAGNFLMSLSWAAVPCFMMISGALMHQSTTFTWKKYFSRVAGNYIVLCVWRGIYLLVNLMTGVFSFGKLQIIQYLFFLKDLEGINTGVMWYMIAFLFVQMLYPVTYYLFRGIDESGGRRILFYMMSVAFAGGILIPSCSWALKFMCRLLGTGSADFDGLKRIMPFSSYANMLFYFIAGAFIYEYRRQISDRIRTFRMWLLPAVILGTGGLMTVKYFDSGTFRWNNTFLNAGYSHILTGVVAAGLLLFFMEYEKQMTKINHLLGKYIGQHTMGIYYLHYIILTVCAVYLYPYFENKYSLALNLAKMAVITAVCVIITLLLKRIPVLRKLVQ